MLSTGIRLQTLTRRPAVPLGPLRAPTQNRLRKLSFGRARRSVRAYWPYNGASVGRTTTTHLRPASRTFTSSGPILPMATRADGVVGHWQSWRGCSQALLVPYPLGFTQRALVFAVMPRFGNFSPVVRHRQPILRFRTPVAGNRVGQRALDYEDTCASKGHQLIPWDLPDPTRRRRPGALRVAIMLLREQHDGPLLLRVFGRPPVTDSAMSSECRLPKSLSGENRGGICAGSPFRTFVFALSGQKTCRCVSPIASTVDKKGRLDWPILFKPSLSHRHAPLPQRGETVASRGGERY